MPAKRRVVFSAYGNQLPLTRRRLVGGVPVYSNAPIS